MRSRRSPDARQTLASYAEEVASAADARAAGATATDREEREWHPLGVLGGINLQVREAYLQCHG